MHVPPSTRLWLFSSIALLWSSAALAEADYRTVVVFGDTQGVTNEAENENPDLDGDGDGNDLGYSRFASMVDWIVANREAENVDFVLHVGDVIQSGEYQCKNNPSAENCERSDHQWARFVTQFDKLEAAGIHYAIARGNHDNKGGNQYTNLGFNSLYGRYQDSSSGVLYTSTGRVPGTSESCDEGQTCPEGHACVDSDGDAVPDRCVIQLPKMARGAQGLVAECTSCPNHDPSRAWQFSLGPTPVLVLSIPYGAAAQTRDWVEDQLRNASEVPAVILSHTGLSSGSSLWTQYVGDFNGFADQPVEFTEQVFMTAQGHTGADVKEIRNIGGYKVLRVHFDRSAGGGNQSNANIAVIRFYFGPDLDEASALTLVPSDTQPESPTIQIGGGLAQTAFSVTDDADYDGVIDNVDNCFSAHNPNQENVDGDFFGDPCDNCISVANTDFFGDWQNDFDSDGAGDACDNCQYASNPDQVDSDDFLGIPVPNGYGDACPQYDEWIDLGNGAGFFIAYSGLACRGSESGHCGDPDGVGQCCIDRHSRGDSDQDGLPNLEDNCALTANPGQEDADADDIGDACDDGLYGPSGILGSQPPTGYTGP